MAVPGVCKIRKGFIFENKHDDRILDMNNGFTNVSIFLKIIRKEEKDMILKIYFICF